MARQQARRRHRERLAGITVVVLGAAVAVIAVLALRNPKSHVAAASQSASSAGRTAASTSSAPKKSSSRRAAPSSSTSSSTGSATTTATGVKSVPLIVLNNSTVGGLATRAKNQFENGGWTVSSIGNLTNNILSSCAYYDPDVAGARDAAEALRQQFPGIARVKKRFAELPTGPVVVVLTSGYANS